MELSKPDGSRLPHTPGNMAQRLRKQDEAARDPFAHSPGMMDLAADYIEAMQARIDFYENVFEAVRDAVHKV